MQIAARVDPATIIDRATYEEPHQYPRGISTVIVNGVVVADSGEHTGALPGRVEPWRRYIERGMLLPRHFDPAGRSMH